MAAQSNLATRARRGSILRKLVITIGVVLGLALIFIAIEVTIALTAKPVPAIDYGERIREATLERQRTLHGEGPDQWPQFNSMLGLVQTGSNYLEQQTQALTPDPDNTYSYVGFSVILRPEEDPYRPQDASTAANYLDARERAIRALEHWRSIGIFEASAELPEMLRVAFPPVPGPMGRSVIPQLGQARQLVRALAARMRLAAVNGDQVERLMAFEEGLALARATSSSGPILGWLTGAAIQGMMLGELKHGLYLHPVDDEAWLAAADAIIERELVRHMITPEQIRDNKHLEHLDEVQRSFTEGGRFVPREYAKLQYGFNLNNAPDHLMPFGDTAWSNLHGRAYLGRGTVTQWFERANELGIEAYRARGTAMALADERLANHVATADRRNPVGQSMTDPSQFIWIARQSDIQVAGTRVLLAIERYRLRNQGRLPRSLDDLGDLLPESRRTDPIMRHTWAYAPTPGTSGWNGEPLDADDEPWPYTLQSHPMPDLSTPFGDFGGRVLITTPMYLPDYAVR